jgi:hypothetical protein
MGRSRTSGHITPEVRASAVATRCSSCCARSSPARALLGLLVWSLSIRRSAASTRSRARSKSVTVYCRDCGGVRFPRGPFDALFAGMADLGCFTVFLSGIASMQYNRLSLSLIARKAPRTIVQCAGRPPQQSPSPSTLPATTASGTHGHAALPTIHKLH